MTTNCERSWRIVFFAIAMTPIAACEFETANGSHEGERTLSEIRATASRLAVPLPAVRTEIDSTSVTPAIGSRWSTSAPARADQPFSIGVDGAARSLRLHWNGALAAQRSDLEEQLAVYRSVYPSTDALVITGSRRTQVLYVLNDPRAPRRWTWGVEPGSAIRHADAGSDGAVVFRDARGEAVMRAPSGTAADAEGHLFPVTVRWDETHAALVYELAGEPRAWPVLVDPVIEGIDWTLRDTSAGPAPARASHAAVYDSNRGRVVIHGGFDSVQRFDDLWEWDGAVWRAVPAASPPLARYSHGIAYDSARRRIVLFGGSGASTRLGDTWEWDGTNWTPFTSTPSPPARYRHALAYDAARGRVVLFGGIDTGLLGDTWDWDGTNWTQHTTTPSPPARHAHAMAYDSVRQRIVLFGGSGASGLLGDTWEWDGANWASFTSASTPSARQSHAMAYDAVRQRVVLFGGQNSAGVDLAETWEWDGTNWTQQPTTTAPSRRVFTAMASDARGGVTLFGGFDTGVLGDTWELHTTRLRGSDCTTDAECQTGHCVDAVCCDSACGGGASSDCQACSRVAGALADGTCGAVGAGRTCRDATGVCDVAEACDGSSMACPADGFAPSTRTCRMAAGDCDIPESCTGAGVDCPVDRLADATVVCRAAIETCDLAETCSGTDPMCPADRFADASQRCRPAAGACDITESCTGSGPSCPPDLVASSAQVCRISAGPCDVAELCTGLEADCPLDGFADSTTECRAAASVCDVAERCSGASADCPGDAFGPAGSSCADTDRCNGDETCDGAGHCSTGSTVSCPPPASRCETARCDSASGSCVTEPLAAGSDCDDGDPCNGTDTCNGAGVCIAGASPTDAGAACDAGAIDAGPRDSGETDASDAIDIVDVSTDERRDVSVDERDVSVDAGVDVINRVDVATDSPDAGTSPSRSGCGCHVPMREERSGRDALFAVIVVGSVVSRRRRANPLTRARVDPV